MNMINEKETRNMKQHEDCEDNKQTESLADLPVTEKHAEQATGGRGVITYTYTVNNTSSAD